MARVTVLEDSIQEFVVLIEKHLDVVERAARRSKRRIPVGKSGGQLARQARKMGAWYYEYLSIYLSHLDTLYLRIDLYGPLSQVNRGANEMAGRLARQASKLADETSDVVVMIGLEAHHFIPQTVLADFPMLRMIFPDADMMPAVNLTKLEHRGSLMLLQRLSASGDVPGILQRLPRAQRLESVTTAINNAVREVREGMTASGPDAEKQATLALLDKLTEVYEARFPALMDSAIDLDGDSAWTMRKWIQKTRQTVKKL